MKIESIRLGHANNSSSTHSILLDAEALTGSGVDRGSYGWEWFHLTEEGDKRDYLYALIFSQLRKSLGDMPAALVAREVTKSDIPEDEYTYVDHQSVLTFPRLFGHEELDYTFMAEMVAYIATNKRASIRGGNDNSDAEDFGGKELEINKVPRDTDRAYKHLVCRKDGDWWTIFNQYTGAKIRMSFKDDAEPYVRASLPELIDVKLTDKCLFGCHFCYQSSTPDGKHAEMYGEHHLRSLLEHIGTAKVFEVALGGGEPTTHPDFDNILGLLHGRGVVPNFTTFNMDWTTSSKLVKAVTAYAGSFAVSKPSKAVVDAIVEWNAIHDRPKGTLQIPMGAYPEKTVKEIILYAERHDVPITLLGYKHFGRGIEVKPKSYEWVLGFLKKSKVWRFGADTLFVQQFGEQLKKNGVHPSLFVGAEGQFSCYIDAVAGKIGASSYTDDMKDIPRKTERGGKAEPDYSKLFESFPFHSSN